MINNEFELLDMLKQCELNQNYKEGLQLIEKHEDLITKLYYEITKYKIEFFIKVNKLIDASIIIKQELSVPYIPKDFEEFLHKKNKEISLSFNDKKAFKITYEDIENIDKVDENTLMIILPHLKEFNLNGITKNLQNIFDNNQISPLLKSVVIASLSDCKLDCNFTVVKEGTLIKFNPISVFDIRVGDNFLFIQNELKQMDDLEINILEIISRLAISYLLDLYPLVISEHYCLDILTAALQLTSIMTNKELVVGKYLEIYNSNPEKIQKICEKMNILLESI